MQKKKYCMKNYLSLKTHHLKFSTKSSFILNQRSSWNYLFQLHKIYKQIFDITLKKQNVKYLYIFHEGYGIIQ